MDAREADEAPGEEDPHRQRRRVLDRGEEDAHLPREEEAKVAPATQLGVEEGAERRLRDATTVNATCAIASWVRTEPSKPQSPRTSRANQGAVEDLLAGVRAGPAIRMLPSTTA